MVVLEKHKHAESDFKKTPWGHPLSTYATFSEKLTFLTPDTQTYMYVSKG